MMVLLLLRERRPDEWRVGSLAGPCTLVAPFEHQQSASPSTLALQGQEDSNDGTCQSAHSTFVFPSFDEAADDTVCLLL